MRETGIRYIPNKIKNSVDPLPTAAVLPNEIVWKRTVGRARLSAMKHGSRRLTHEKGRPIFEDLLTRVWGELISDVTSLPPGKRPTFHEIGSLGEAVYKRRGEDVSVTQRRMTHHNPNMTAHYDTGHPVHYEPVVCDLDVFELGVSDLRDL